MTEMEIKPQPMSNSAFFSVSIRLCTAVCFRTCLLLENVSRCHAGLLRAEIACSFHFRVSENRIGDLELCEHLYGEEMSTTSYRYSFRYCIVKSIVNDRGHMLSVAEQTAAYDLQLNV